MAYGPVNAFQMNQYAVACTQTKQGAIIDCGAATRRELQAFLDWFQQHEYRLTQVWQTHAHLDHVAGLGLLRTLIPLDDDVPIYLHEKERIIYNNFQKTKDMYGFPVEEGCGILPDDSELTYFGGGEEEDPQVLTLGKLNFDIISTPGHSPGHVGFFETQTKSFFGGDFIMQGSIGRTDFPTSSPKEMRTSLRKFIQTMDSETVIYPGHGSPTTLKREKQYNPFLQDL